MRQVTGTCMLLLLLATPAAAAITAFWVPVAGQPWHVPYPPAAVANAPELANMETWDLTVTTDGDWASAGMRATLPAGATYFHHPFGGNTKPNLMTGIPPRRGCLMTPTSRAPATTA